MVAYLPQRYPTVHRFDNRQTVRLTAGFTTGYMTERPKGYLSKKEASPKASYLVRPHTCHF